MEGKWHVREGNDSLFEKRKAMAVRNVMICVCICHDSMPFIYFTEFFFPFSFSCSISKDENNTEWGGTGVGDEKLMKIERRDAWDEEWKIFCFVF